MADPKLRIENDVLWQQVIDHLHFMRDTLVLTSEGFRELMFEMDAEARQAADDAAADILKNVKR